MRTNINTTINCVRPGFICRTIVGGMGDVVRMNHGLYLRHDLPAAALAAKAAACATPGSKCSAAQGCSRQRVQQVAVAPPVSGRRWRERPVVVSALSRLS